MPVCQFQHFPWLPSTDALRPPPAWAGCEAPYTGALAGLLFYPGGRIDCVILVLRPDGREGNVRVARRHVKEQRRVAVLSESVQRAQRLTSGQMEELAAELRPRMSGDVRVDRHTRLLYATDASIYQMEPVAVALPRSVDDVAQVMRVAGRHGLPVLPRGGGTSLAGSTVNHAIVVDFSKHMNRVLEVQPEERWALVQPGLVVNHLNRAVAQFGLQYPIDPTTSNRATIGGGIGANSCGAHSVLYRKTLDHVLGMDVVLSDGSQARLGPAAGQEMARKMGMDSLEGRLYREVRRLAATYREEVERRFPKVMRRVSGYNLDEFAEDGSMDLTRMIVGSEGTLAMVAEARVDLVPVPKRKGLAAVHFHDLIEAMEATNAVLEHGPSAVELIDRTVIERCRQALGFRHLLSFVEGAPDCLLFVEFYGETEQEAGSRLEGLRRDLERRGMGYATVLTTDAVQQRQMWAVRESGLGLLMSVRGDTKPLPFVEDTAVAPERLPQFVRSFREIIGRHGTQAAYYGHASVGCLHIRPMVNVKRREGLATMELMAREVADLVLEFGGSLSGEHGDGIVRGAFTERMFGSELYQAFRELKQAFDPDGLMNPGKIIDTPGFSENLRLGPDTLSWEPKTVLDFTADGGFVRAIEQCNGQGACRKLEGTMCPSYMVTREEEHSTRGRANLLRMALSGKLPASELAGKRMHEALDLCVECKGCKAECPSGVDMTKLKAEVLTGYHRVHGVPLRSRLFGHIALLSRLGGMAAPLSNWVTSFPPVRWLMHVLLGIHHRRPLPRLVRTTFSSWFRRNGPPRGRDTGKGEVVLFNDTYMEHFYPEVGRAAVRVLEAWGYRVTLVSQKQCCGRPLISKGMLHKAKAWARQNVDALLPYARRGVPIVGTEPSCLLTLRDEYLDMLGDEAARTVASHAFLLEEFLSRVVAEDPGAADVFQGEGLSPLLVHGHCHQKALIGMDSTLKALRSAGYQAEVVEAGCCGMAGAFGFEAEHYELSRAMGAHRLFPALESSQASAAQVAVTGMSCRQQIGHFTSARPRHVAEYLAGALR